MARSEFREREDRTSRGRDEVSDRRRARDEDDPPFDRENQEAHRRSRYEYKGRTAEDVRRHATQKTTSFDNYLDSSIPSFKPKEGLNVIRFMPPTFGDEISYVYEIHAHYDIGPDHGAYVCMQKMFNKPCAVCDERGKFSEAEQKDLRPRKRYLAWIIDRAAERTGPQFWDLSPTMDKDISAQCLDRHGKITLIDDPENGHDVEFMRSGTRLDTDYTGHKIDRDSSPLHDDEKIQDRWMNFVIDHPLDKMIILPDYDYVAKVFAGQVEARDKDLDEDEDEPRSRVRDTGRRSIREEIDDEIPDRGTSKAEPEARPRRERLTRGRDPELDRDERPTRSRLNRSEDEEADEDLYRGSARESNHRDAVAPRKNVRDDEEDEERGSSTRLRRSEDESSNRRANSRNDRDRDGDDLDLDATDVSSRTRSRLRDMEERNTRRRRE